MYSYFFIILELLLLCGLSSALNCHSSCQNCLFENDEFACTTCGDLNQFNIISKIGGIQIGFCLPNDNSKLSYQAETTRRLLASSGTPGWVIGAIIIGVISMLAFFSLLGLMIFAWKCSNKGNANQGANPQANAQNNVQSNNPMENQNDINVGNANEIDPRNQQPNEDADFEP